MRAPPRRTAHFSPSLLPAPATCHWKPVDPQTEMRARRRSGPGCSGCPTVRSVAPARGRQGPQTQPEEARNAHRGSHGRLRSCGSRPVHLTVYGDEHGLLLPCPRRPRASHLKTRPV